MVHGQNGPYTEQWKLSTWELEGGRGQVSKQCSYITVLSQDGPCAERSTCHWAVKIVTWELEGGRGRVSKQCSYITVSLSTAYAQNGPYALNSENCHLRTGGRARTSEGRAAHRGQRRRSCGGGATSPGPPLVSLLLLLLLGLQLRTTTTKV